MIKLPWDRADNGLVFSKAFLDLICSKPSNWLLRKYDSLAQSRVRYLYEWITDQYLLQEVVPVEVKQK